MQTALCTESGVPQAALLPSEHLSIHKSIPLLLQGDFFAAETVAGRFPSSPAMIAEAINYDNGYPLSGIAFYTEKLLHKSS